MLPALKPLYKSVEKDYKYAVLKITYQGIVETGREYLLVDLPEQMARSIANFLNEPQNPEGLAKAFAATYRSLI